MSPLAPFAWLQIAPIATLAVTNAILKIDTEAGGVGSREELQLAVRQAPSCRP